MQGTGVDEFAAMAAVLKRQGKKPHWVTKDRVLYDSSKRLFDRQTNVQIFSLSPSDAAVTLLKVDLGRYLPELIQPKKRVMARKENHDSIVLYVSIGSLGMLLGGDLEAHGDPKIGWNDILNNPIIRIRKCEVFKIPHHGSVTAHHPGVWRQLLNPNPFTVMTPFRNGSVVLPTRSDIKRVIGLTDAAYITSNPFSKGKIKHKPMVERTVKEVVKRISPSNFQLGQVRLRTRVEDRSGWKIECSSAARHIKSLISW